MSTQRTISGYLQIKNKPFPIYEGVNIIGRDIKATVPLKDAILSKFHAIICVGQGHTHLSDVQSANGTKLGNVKLNPYEIYNIDDKAVITFGNLVGVYYKNANCPPTQQNITMTEFQLCDHDALTQVISEHGTQQNNIHDAQTQITDVNFKNPRANQGKVQKNNSIDIHDQPTQHSNFHEVETQIVENNFKPDDTNINNRLTEIHPFILNNHLAAAGDNKQNRDESAVNDSAIFDAATQLVPTGFDLLNEKAIHLDNDVTVLDDHNSMSDIETQPNPVNGSAMAEMKTPKLSSLPNTNDSISDNETQPNEFSPIHCYDDIFANETFRMSLERSISKYDIVVDETLEIPSGKMINDEIADETQATQPVGFKRKEVKPLVASDDSDDITKPTLPVTQPIGFKRKSVPPLVSSDDSDDIVMGTQDVKKIELDIARSELNSAKYVVSVDSDSETDVEDSEDLSKKVKNMNRKKGNTDSDSGTDVDEDSTSVTPTKSKKKKLVKRREKGTKSDYESDVTEETSSKDRSTLEEETTGQNITNIDSETDVDDNLLIDDKEKELTKNNDDNSDADTQVAELNLAQNKPPAKNCDDVSNVETVEDLNVPDQDPMKKQPDDNISDAETDVEDLNEKAEDSATDVEENLIQDKQQFIEKKFKVKEQNVRSQTPQLNNLVNDSDSDIEDDLLQPVLVSSEVNEEAVDCNSEETSKNEEFVSCSSHNSKNMAHNELQDDGFTAPTQIIEPVNSNKSGVEDAETNELAPTQLLIESFSDEKKTSNKNNEDDLYLQPTQVLELAPTQLLTESIIEGDKEPSCLPSKISDLEDDVFLQPTVKDTEKNELPPTQLLTESFSDEKQTSNKNNEDDLFLQPTQELEIQMEVEENDDVYLQATQILPENKVRVDIYDLATQKLPVSPQNDGVYAIATQKLNHGPNQKFENSLDDSQEGSFRLQMSETEDFIIQGKESLPSKHDVKVVNDESQDLETQLEVNFGLDTQKLYIEKETKRPDNPVGLMFSDEETQETQNIQTTQEKLKDEILSDIENGLQLVPVVAMMDITMSKITLKDIQDASTSTTKKASTKIQKPKVEPIRKSQRNKKQEEIESSDFVKPRKPHNTRGKRLDYKQLVSSMEELEEKISKKTEKAEENEVANPRGRVAKRKTSVSVRSKTEIDSDDEAFVISKRQNRTPVKRTLDSKAKEKERAKNAMLSSIEKFSDSSTSSTDRRKRTKVLKICSSEETEMTSSTPTSYTEESLKTPRKTRTPKRSLPIVTSSEESLAASDATRVSSNADTSTATSVSHLHTPSKKRRRHEQLNVTVTSDSINVDIKHKVVFTMLSDDSFKTSVKKLGGTVIDTINSCTVLVTTKISRSLKFLLAIALGKPIVDVNWIDDSVKEGRFLDPWDYLLHDPDMEKKLDINLKTSLNRSCDKKLLMGETVLLAVNKNYDVLKDIIESSGAKCVNRIPAKVPNLIVVAYEDERSKYSRYLKQKSLTLVSAEAIFCGVLKQEVNWNKYLLT